MGKNDGQALLATLKRKRDKALRSFIVGHPIRQVRIRSGVSPAWAGIFLPYIAESCAFPGRAGGVLPIGWPLGEVWKSSREAVENPAGFSQHPNVVMCARFKSAWVSLKTTLAFQKYNASVHCQSFKSTTPVEGQGNDGKKSRTLSKTIAANLHRKRVRRVSFYSEGIMSRPLGALAVERAILNCGPRGRIWTKEEDFLILSIP